ncbi:MAG TPA: MOSC domain-containing protein [Acidimicrobiia bacterium]|nr:MOSC domain-containing protein [Acidimicrobiia bacterium]
MRLGPEPVRSYLWRRRRDVAHRGRPLVRSGHLDAIFVAPVGAAPMEPRDRVDAIAGRGLQGDRYTEHCGHWSPLDECQVTLVAAEDLDVIEALYGVAVRAGEHRRNLVTRGLDLLNLYGRTFTVGEAVFAFDRPRPPCSYIASITEASMTRALGARRGGICARVVRSGAVQVGDEIVIR